MAKKNMDDIKVTTVITVYNHCFSGYPYNCWKVYDEPVLVTDEGVVEQLQLEVPDGFHVARSGSYVKYVYDTKGNAYELEYNERTHRFSLICVWGDGKRIVLRRVKK